MNYSDKLFLDALCAALRGEKVDWDFEISAEQWNKLFKRAEIHQVLPLIYDAVFRCPAIQSLNPELVAYIKKIVVRQVMAQTMKTAEFLKLYGYLQENKIQPLVVKGIVCRQLYPNPDYRSSSDEDMLIKPREFEDCNKTLHKYGMAVRGDHINVVARYEIPYEKKGSPIHIELHKSLFAHASKEYGEWNQFFKGVHHRAVKVNVNGTDIMTLGYTENLFYLICHALKHFLHSGFGVRQLCDIVMFANAYGCEIDWETVLENCRQIRADRFAAALFKIGEKYLNFQPEKACYPKAWRDIYIDEHALLHDMLQGGLYGDADMSRKHSSSLTLGAVRDEKEGKKAKGSIMKAVFPGVGGLKGRYHYLEKYPVLLPVAWADRIFRYQREIQHSIDNSAAQSIKIGNRRIELLKEYGIINDEKF